MKERFQSIKRHLAVSGIDRRIIVLVLTIVFLFVLGDVIDLMFKNDELMFAVTAVATLVGIIGGMTISRRIGRRLRSLEEGVSNIARGDLGYRVPIKGNDEVTRVGRAFNRMASQLHKRTEELTRERNRIRSVHQAIADGIVVFNRDGRIVSINPAAEAAIGRLQEELSGCCELGIRAIDEIMVADDIVPEGEKVRCWVEKKCTHPECPAYGSSDLRCWLQCGTCCHNAIQGTFSQKRDACERCDIYAKNGIRTCEFEKGGHTYSVRISPVLDDEGHEEGRMAALHDITYVRSAQEALQIRNRELTVINEIAASLTQSLDDTGAAFDDVLARIDMAVNVQAGVIMLRDRDNGEMRLAAFRGMSPHTALFLQLLDLSREIGNAEEAWSDVIDSDELLTRHKSILPALEKEGLKKPLVVPLWAKGDVVGLLMLLDDIRDEYTSDEIRLIVALAAQIGVTIQNVELFNNVANAKKAWETTFDSMKDGISVHDIDNNIVRANRNMANMLNVSMEQLLGRKCYEVVHKRNTPIALCPRDEVVRTGKSVSIEMEEERLGKTFRLSVNPIKDVNGDVIGLVHTLRDITERKQLREQLLQSEKMAAVGQLVSGVAHELNNPLTGVMGYSQLLLRRCGDDELRSNSDMKDVEKDLNSIYGEAQRASKIVQNLLSFARKHQPQKDLIDLNEAIRNVLELRAYELNVSNIDVSTDLDPGLPRVLADFHQVEQVLLNIINNAEQAITGQGDRGAISISTGHEDDMVTIRVSDNGMGIGAENMPRIFDPFFTTKEVGKGTGLGLSICYGIIEEHGGEIRVESKVNEGTTIVIELAAATEAPTGPVEEALKASKGKAGSGRVLVVDDEPAIIDLLTDILTMAGYGVDVARNGASALKKLARMDYDNVITDIKMPQMDGKELHRRIGEIDPALAANVIFITGDAVSNDTREYLDSTGNVYLVKPFDLHELRDTLGKVMKNGR